MMQRYFKEEIIFYNIFFLSSDRRKVRLADPDRYKELVLEYNGEIEKLMLAAEDKLLAEVNIDKE